MKSSEGSGPKGNFWNCFWFLSVTLGVWVIVQGTLLTEVKIHEMSLNTNANIFILKTSLMFAA